MYKRNNAFDHEKKIKHHIKIYDNNYIYTSRIDIYKKECFLF